MCLFHAACSRAKRGVPSRHSPLHRSDRFPHRVGNVPQTAERFYWTPKRPRLRPQAYRRGEASPELVAAQAPERDVLPAPDVLRFDASRCSRPMTGICAKRPPADWVLTLGRPRRGSGVFSSQNRRRRFLGLYPAIYRRAPFPTDRITSISARPPCFAALRSAGGYAGLERGYDGCNRENNRARRTGPPCRRFGPVELRCLCRVSHRHLRRTALASRRALKLTPPRFRAIS